MNSGKVLLGAIAGIAIGAMAGILLAPDKGSVTRKKIRGVADDYIDEIKSKYSTDRPTMAAKASDMKKDGDDGMKSEKSKFDEVKKDLKSENFGGKHATT